MIAQHRKRSNLELRRSAPFVLPGHSATRNQLHLGAQMFEFGAALGDVVGPFHTHLVVGDVSQENAFVFSSLTFISRWVEVRP